MYIKKWKVGDIFGFWRSRMEEDRIDKEGKGDKIGDFTRDYADVIGRNQIRGSKKWPCKSLLPWESKNEKRWIRV